MHEYQSSPTVVVQLEGGTYTLLIGRRCEQVGSTLDFLYPLHCPLPAQPCSSTGRAEWCANSQFVWLISSALFSFIFAWQHEPQLLICPPQ